jgi:hypothetical protein
MLPHSHYNGFCHYPLPVAMKLNCAYWKTNVTFHAYWKTNVTFRAYWKTNVTFNEEEYISKHQKRSRKREEILVSMKI